MDTDHRCSLILNIIKIGIAADPFELKQNIEDERPRLKAGHFEEEDYGKDFKSTMVSHGKEQFCCNTAQYGVNTAFTIYMYYIQAISISFLSADGFAPRSK